MKSNRSTPKPASSFGTRSNNSLSWVSSRFSDSPLPPVKPSVPQAIIPILCVRQAMLKLLNQWGKATSDPLTPVWRSGDNMENGICTSLVDLLLLAPYPTPLPEKPQARAHAAFLVSVLLSTSPMFITALEKVVGRWIMRRFTPIFKAVTRWRGLSYLLT